MENKIGHLHINAPLGPIWSTIFQLFLGGEGANRDYFIIFDKTKV